MPTPLSNRLSKLNPAQRKAVDTIDGPVMVVAGPGTGKTETLGARITNILELQTDLEPGNILCLTYTDAGTVAMRKRLLSFLGPKAHKIAIHTFHSFSNTVLQENAEYFNIKSAENISEIDQYELLESILQTLPANDPHFQKVGFSFAPDLLKFFNLCKQEHWTEGKMTSACSEYINDLPSREEFQYKRKYTNKKTGETFVKGDAKTPQIEAEKKKIQKVMSAMSIFTKYATAMKEQGKYDFADMILWVLDGFKNNEALLGEYQERFLYILVDEFQDTNGSQKELLDILTSYWDDPNIFVVGDDDQSIYKFQGANMQNIMEYYHQYSENIEVITLDKNYRSTQSILDFANKIIETNEQRLIAEIPNLNKTLISQIDGKEIKPSLRGYYNELHEDLGILKRLRALQERGENLGEIAVIYKNHSQAQNLLHLCNHFKIPVNIKRQQNIFELPIIKHIFMTIEYIATERKASYSGEHILFQMLFFPWSGYKGKEISSLALQRKTSFGSGDVSEKKYFKDLISESDFSVSLTKLEELYDNIPFVVFIQHIFEECKIIEWALSQDDKGFQLSVLSTFFHWIQDLSKKEFGKSSEFDAYTLLDIYKKMEAYNLPLSVNKIQSQKEGVNFITAHSSKGLEFEYVFLKGVTKNAWDKKRGENYKIPDTLVVSNDGDHTEELRRLFFVASTRAKKFLEISYPQKKQSGEELQPSLLISESEEILTPESVAYEENEIDEILSILLRPENTESDILEKQFLHELLENYTLSPTHLNKYLECPRAFYFENLLRIPQAMNSYAIFGNAIHAALESVFITLKKGNEIPRNELTTLAQEIAHKSLQESSFALTTTEHKKLIKQSDIVLQTYFDEEHGGYDIPKNIAQLKTEYSIKTGIEEIPIKGKLDKIEEISPGYMKVTDYKTGNAASPFTKKKLAIPSEKNQMLGGEYWRQIMFYALLIENNPRGKAFLQEGVLDFVEPVDGKCIKHQILVDDEGKKRISELIASVYAGIQAGNFEGCGEEECGWCSR